MAPELAEVAELDDEPDDGAMQLSRSSAASCACAAVRAAWLSLSVCCAERSWRRAEASDDWFCARCEAVPPASALARFRRAIARDARAEARFVAASVASIVAMTWPFTTRSPTATRTEVSVPLVVNPTDAVSAEEMFPEPATLDSTVPRVTVAVRCAPDAEELPVPTIETAAKPATTSTSTTRKP